jgi:hypothetical protein
MHKALRLGIYCAGARWLGMLYHGMLGRRRHYQEGDVFEVPSCVQLGSGLERRHRHLQQQDPASPLLSQLKPCRAQSTTTGSVFSAADLYYVCMTPA